MKILVLGNGKHTNRRIIPALKKLNAVTSVVVGDRNVTRDKTIDDLVTISSYRQSLVSDNVFDLSIIATPPENHLESFEGIRKKSKKVLIEKPITMDMSYISTNEFSQYLNRKLLFEAIMYFHHPVWKKVKDIIETKKIININAQFSVPHVGKCDYRYSRHRGGGSLGDQGIYPISLISVLVKENYKINNISTSSAKGYEVDLSGEIDLTLDSKINFIGKWGLGEDYKNFLKLTEEDGTSYEINFFFSKPDSTEAIINVFKGNSKEEIVVGRYDQFELMYKDALNDNLNNFFYTTPKHLLLRYSIFKEVLEDINYK